MQGSLEPRQSSCTPSATAADKTGSRGSLLASTVKLCSEQQNWAHVDSFKVNTWADSKNINTHMGHMDSKHINRSSSWFQPLWKKNQFGWLFPIYGKIKMFQSPPIRDIFLDGAAVSTKTHFAILRYIYLGKPSFPMVFLWYVLSTMGTALWAKSRSLVKNRVLKLETRSCDGTWVPHNKTRFLIIF